MIFQHDTPINRLLNLAIMNGVGKLVEETVTGNPVSFETDVAKPLNGLLIPFAPVQSGTGDPSPDNVRPIAGWNGLNISHAGKNLFDQEKYSSASEYKTTLSYYKYTDPIMLKPNTTYSITPTERKNVGSGIYYVLYIVSGSDPTAFSGSTVYPVSNGNTGSIAYFTTGETGAIRFGVSENDTQTKIDAIMSVDWQIEAGSTASTYEPFVSLDSYPVVFSDGQTIYGGTLDALTGVLTVTHKLIDLISISSNLWTKSTSYPGGFYCNIRTGRFGIKEQTDFICSHAKTAHILSEYEYGTCYCDGSVNIRIMQSGSELSDWQTYLSEQSQNGTPVCICAELAESYTVQLDPVALSTLIGTNTIWTDTNGENEIIYKKKG